MRHKVSGRKFDRPTNSRMAMFKGLTTDLIRHRKVTTTLPKAKEVRGFAEKVITLAKDGSLHSRRRAYNLMLDKKLVDEVFEELGEQYKDRGGGYTRTIKLGPRKGDGAEMAILELVE
jgi:large subunit ribosomal protein L17